MEVLSTLLWSLNTAGNTQMFYEVPVISRTHL